MSLPPEPWRLPLLVVVLAAQRKGVIDPLAERAGVSHKCLVPIGGRPLIAHVVQTLLRHTAVARIAISVEDDAFAAVRAVLPSKNDARDRIEYSAARDNIADSVREAIGSHPGPIVITTADNILLTCASIDAVLAGLKCSEAVVAMASREVVLAAHALGQRRFYRFRGGEFSNCNLYGLSSRSALSAAEAFRSGGQFAKKAWQIVNTFGLLNLVLLRLRVVSLEGAMRRISSRLGVRIAPVVLFDGTQAIDVDNERTFAIAEEIVVRCSRLANAGYINDTDLARSGIWAAYS